MRSGLAVVLAVVLGSCASPSGVGEARPPVDSDALRTFVEGAHDDPTWWIRGADDASWRQVDDGSIGLEQVDVEPLADGGARVQGVLTRRAAAGPGERVAVFATTAAPPVRTLDRQDLEDRVDPYPALERSRLPFQLAVAPGGLPLVRDDDGRARIALFAVVTSEDGPATLVVLRLTF